MNDLGPVLELARPSTLGRLWRAGAMHPQGAVGLAWALPWLLGRGPSLLGILSRIPVPPETVLRACQAELASFKVPRRVEQVDSLPRTATGKVLKRDLLEGGGNGGSPVQKK